VSVTTKNRRESGGGSGTYFVQTARRAGKEGSREVRGELRGVGQGGGEITFKKRAEVMIIRTPGRVRQ